MSPLVASELLVEQLIGGILSVETPSQLLVLKLPLIKAARCTFSDWKQYINLVFAKWECQLDSLQMSCLTIVLGISCTHHVSNEEV